MKQTHEHLAPAIITVEMEMQWLAAAWLQRLVSIPLLFGHSLKLQREPGEDMPLQFCTRGECSIRASWSSASQCFFLPHLMIDVKSFCMRVKDERPGGG